MHAKFRRSDGIEFDTAEGSAAFELMQKDGGFTRLDPATGEEFKAPEMETATDESSSRTLGAGDGDKTPVDLTKLKKDDLLAEAAKRGLQLVPDDVTRKQIIAAIEAADAEKDKDPVE